MGQGTFRKNKLVALRHYMIKSNTTFYIFEEKALSRNLETHTAVKDLGYKSDQHDLEHNQRFMSGTGHIPL